MCRKILIDTLLLKIATVVAFPHAYISTRTTNIISSNPLNSESRIRYIRLIDGYRAYSDQVIPRDEAGSGWGDIPKCACVLRGSGWTSGRLSERMYIRGAVFMDRSDHQLAHVMMFLNLQYELYWPMECLRPLGQLYILGWHSFRLSMWPSRAVNLRDGTPLLIWGLEQVYNPTFSSHIAESMRSAGQVTAELTTIKWAIGVNDRISAKTDLY